MKSQAVLAGLFAALLAAPAAAQTVGIITTPVGSYSHSAGSALAKVIDQQAGVHAVVQAQASTGFEQVEAGEVEFNVSNSFDATFFATGTGEYAGKGKNKNIRFAAVLIPYRVALHVRKNSSIKTIADLKGKRLGSGFNAQKTIGRIIAAELANAGLSYDDVIKVPTPNVVRQAQDFVAGRVDAMFFAIGSGQSKQAAASVGGIRVLPIDDSPAALKRMHDVLPGSYVLKVNPRPGLDGISKPTNVFAFNMVLNVSAKVPDDVVYRVVKAIHGAKGELVKSFRPFVLFDPARMAMAPIGLPVHPGAAKYYKEIGLAPKP